MDTIKKGGSVFNYVPTTGITNLCRFLEESNYRTFDGGYAVGFKPENVMSWCEYLDMDLTKEEKRQVIRLSSYFVDSVQEFNCNGDSLDPHEQALVQLGV